MSRSIPIGKQDHIGARGLHGHTVAPGNMLRAGLAEAVGTF